MREVNQACLDIIKKWEGCKLEAYDDGGGVWTIGVGHTKGVQKGDTITELQADDFLQEDLSDATAGVQNAVKVMLSDNQFAACVSLAFNIGSGGFAGSTLVKKLNASDYIGAANEFPRWNKDNGVEVKGLTYRRYGEQQLFLTPDTSD
jgi:lysozyme